MQGLSQLASLHLRQVCLQSTSPLGNSLAVSPHPWVCLVM